MSVLEPQYEFELDEALAKIRESLQGEDMEKFRSDFLDYHLYDQAQIYLALAPEERIAMYNYLSVNEMADMFEIIEEDVESIEAYLLEMNNQYAADMLANMYADNAVDMLKQLKDERIWLYLRLMPMEAAKEIRALLNYEDETAGAIMTPEFVSIVANQTVRSAMAILKSKAPDAETIYYIYVVNVDNVLVGVISLRDLIVNDEDMMISDIMSERVVSVNVNEGQEDVAHKIRDYDFLAVPVVDENNVLLGIITVDDIIDVIDEEAVSDFSGLAGVDVEEQSENPFVAASKRLPWLITLLFLGMGTSTLISQYEGLISDASILSVFVTLITGTSGNAGTQSLAVAVRKIGMQDDEEKNLFRTILSELATGVISGLVTGVTIALVISVWKQNFILGGIIGISMLVAITVANLAGSLIPVLMDRLGFDPAVASGPFISTFSDLTSVLIYFNIAKHFINTLM